MAAVTGALPRGSDLADGLHRITATATDTAGNTSGQTAAWNITVDTVAPNAPVIVTIEDDIGSIKGNIGKNGVTDDKRPTLNGTAEANSLVTIYIDGIAVGSTRANGSGNWSFIPASDLSDGLHHISAKASDSAGNSSGEAVTWDITVDTVISTPTIDTVYDNAGSKTGNVSNGGRTDDTTPTLSGRAEANSVVTIYDGSTKLGSVTAGADGKWTFTPSSALGSGSHNFNIQATDKAGNISGKSQGWNINIGPDYVSKEFSENFSNNPSPNVGTHYNGFTFKSYTGRAAPRIGSDSNVSMGLLIGNSGGFNDYKAVFELDNLTTDYSMDLYQVNGKNSVTVNYLDEGGNILKSEVFSGADIEQNVRRSTYSGQGIKYVEILAVEEAQGIFIDNIKMTSLLISGYDAQMENIEYELLKEDHIESIIYETNTDKEGVLNVDDLSSSYGVIYYDDILDKSIRDGFINDGKEQVLIKGDEVDTIVISDLLKDGTDIGDWKQVTGTVSVEGAKYEIYQHSGSDLELLVQQGVKVELDNH